MEREQIIKALECCTTEETCENCPLSKAKTGYAMCNIDKKAFELIKELTEENARLSFFNEEKAEAVRYEAITEYKKSIIDYYSNDSRYDRPNAHTLLIRLFSLLEEKAKEILNDLH